MRLLHTGDWHLGDRLNHIDRTADLRHAVERIAGYCLERDVEVLLVAGDLFSERSRADALRASIAHLHETFQPFLGRGGTIVAITGNHDNETFCRTLWHAMSLAAAGPNEGTLVPSGRFYLAAAPTFFRLCDCAGQEVQFVLMPYPTEHCYFDGETPKYASLEEKHAALRKAFAEKVRSIQDHPAFRSDLPTVLSAHINVQGSALPTLFRITEQEDIVFTEADLPAHWSYVALGHIHRPQCLMGQPHVRYSGSIERLDMGEQGDSKSVTLVEIGPQGLLAPPELLPLEATPFLDIAINHPAQELPRLRAEHANANGTLVRCLVDYQRGRDDVNAIQRELRSIFPNCYQMICRDPSDLLLRNGSASGPLAQQSVRELVMEYLKSQLADHADRDAVLRLAETLLLEEAP
jgi:exonuclease SbcD